MKVNSKIKKDENIQSNTEKTDATQSDSIENKQVYDT